MSFQKSHFIPNKKSTCGVRTGANKKRKTSQMIQKSLNVCWKGGGEGSGRPTANGTNKKKKTLISLLLVFRTCVLLRSFHCCRDGSRPRERRHHSSLALADRSLQDYRSRQGGNHRHYRHRAAAGHGPPIARDTNAAGRQD